jgi:hypothetical protein
MASIGRAGTENKVSDLILLADWIAGKGDYLGLYTAQY